MRSVPVVILLPCSDGGAGLSDRREQRLIQALVAEAAVEAFDEAVLHRLAGGDVMPVDLCLLAPFEDGHAGHLRSVVRDDRPRFSAFGDETIQLAGKPCPRQGCIGDQAQAFAGEVVNDGQNTKAATVGEGIADEVQAPALIGARGQSQRTPCPQGPLSAATLAHRQLLLPIETSKLLQVHDDPLPVEHDVDAPVTEAPPLGCHLLHRLPNDRIVRPHAAISHARTINRQNLARPTLAHPVLHTDMSHRIPLHIGRHHFLQRHPSGSHCPALPRRAASSVWHSRPRAPSACGHPTRPCRYTSPCICRRLHPRCRACGRHQPSSRPPPAPSISR